MAPKQDTLYTAPNRAPLTHGEKLSLRVSAATLAVMGAIGLTGCATGNAEAQPPTVSHSAEATPSAEPTPEVTKPSIDVSQIPADVIEYNLFETLTDEQQAEIRAMEAQPLEEFRLRPDAEQRTFARFVFDNNIDVLKYRLDATNQSSIYENANFDSANGMRNSEDLKIALLASLKYTPADGGVAFDTDTALKASVFLYPEGHTIAQENFDNAIKSWNLNTTATLRKVTYVDSATLEDGSIISNEINDDTNEAYQSTYGLIDVTKINGEVVKDSITLLSVNEGDPRYDYDIHQK